MNGNDPRFSQLVRRCPTTRADCKLTANCVNLLLAVSRFGDKDVIIEPLRDHDEDAARPAREDVSNRTAVATEGAEEEGEDVDSHAAKAWSRKIE